MAVNQNVPSCVASGTNNGCRPNPDYANNNQYSPVAASDYHGLHVSLQQRPGQWGYYRVSYTFSKSMNNVGENFFSSPIDPFDLSKDWVDPTMTSAIGLCSRAASTPRWRRPATRGSSSPTGFN